MKISLHQKNSGMAVIVALIAVTVLTILAGAFAYSMKVETRLAQNADNDEQLLWMGRGGVEFARWVIALSGSQQADSLNQIWAGGPGAGTETNGPLMGVSLENYPIGEGTVSLKIIDLERKVNINTASDPLLRQVLTVMGVDAGDISSVSDAIQDWVDADDSTRPAGAESDFYQGQPFPYYAKNAPMDDISELLLLKGVTLEMFKGGSAAEDQGAAFQHHKMGFGHAPGEAPSYAFGLADVLTPFSSGKININTADMNVLQLIPGMDTASAESVMKFRAGPDGQAGTEDDTPFLNPGMLAAAGVDPRAIPQMTPFIDVHSRTFEVHAIAHIGDYSREFIAVIFRGGPNPQVVSFYWK